MSAEEEGLRSASEQGSYEKALNLIEAGVPANNADAVLCGVLYNGHGCFASKIQLLVSCSKMTLTTSLSFAVVEHAAPFRCS